MIWKVQQMMTKRCEKSEKKKIKIKKKRVTFFDLLDLSFTSTWVIYLDCCYTPHTFFTCFIPYYNWLLWFSTHPMDSGWVFFELGCFFYFCIITFLQMKFEIYIDRCILQTEADPLLIISYRIPSLSYHHTLWTADYKNI